MVTLSIAGLAFQVEDTRAMVGKSIVGICPFRIPFRLNTILIPKQCDTIIFMRE